MITPTTPDNVIAFHRDRASAFRPGDPVWFWNAMGVRVDATFEQRLGDHARVVVKDPTAAGINVDRVLRLTEIFYAKPPTTPQAPAPLPFGPKSRGPKSRGPSNHGDAA